MTSSLSFGCHNLTGGSSHARSVRLIHAALDLGIVRFDVAPAYGLGTAERTLGVALGRRRNDPALEITSKFGILPDRNGPVKALLREPYRVLKSLWPGQSASRSRGTPSSSRVVLLSRPFPYSARESTGRSLAALGVERLSALLSHELLPEPQRSMFPEAMDDLLRSGMIGRAGCSGALGNVKAMLETAAGTATVAQTTISDLDRLPDGVERRGFSVARAARVLAFAPQLATARVALADVLPEAGGAGVSGADIAAVLTVAQRRHPAAILLVNASTSERLLAAVTPVTEGRLVYWAAAFEATVAPLIFGGLE